MMIIIIIIRIIIISIVCSKKIGADDAGLVAVGKDTLD